MGATAACQAAAILRGAIAQRGSARLVVATGNSQDGLIDSLVVLPELDWKRIDVFHLDEYVGIGADHPASFRRWLRTKVVEIVHPNRAHYLAGDAADVERECARYAELLTAAPIDLCFIGFGENGHIAFNDPHAADFTDPGIARTDASPALSLP